MTDSFKTRKRKLLLKQPCCIWCGQPMSLKRGRKNFATWEHLLPNAYGGDAVFDAMNKYHGNKWATHIVLACKPCNDERDVDLFYWTEHTPKHVIVLLTVAYSWIMQHGTKQQRAALIRQSGRL